MDLFTREQETREGVIPEHAVLGSWYRHSARGGWRGAWPCCSVLVSLPVYPPLPLSMMGVSRGENEGERSCRCRRLQELNRGTGNRGLTAERTHARLLPRVSYPRPPHGYVHHLAVLHWQKDVTPPHKPYAEQPRYPRRPSCANDRSRLGYIARFRATWVPSKKQGISLSSTPVKARGLPKGQNSTPSRNAGKVLLPPCGIRRPSVNGMRCICSIIASVFPL